MQVLEAAPFSQNGSLQRPLSALEAALLYAKEGWCVFPILGPEYTYLRKKGRIEKYPFFGTYQKATTNEKIIRRWFLKHPLANVGIRTGQCSNLFVLDIDGPHGYICTPEPLMILPKTRCALTGKGRHLFFRLPPGVIIHTSIALLDLQLDVFGEEEGFVTAPPSRHNSGKLYTWQNFDVPVAMASVELCNFLATMPEIQIKVNYRRTVHLFVNTAIRHTLALIGK